MTYLLRRLLLLPLTLFAIILVNFIILNLVPGDPVTVTDRSQTGDAMRSTQAGAEEHLLFREHYGLTLPILINTWWRIPRADIEQTLEQLSTKLTATQMSVHAYNRLRTRTGDQARFTLPLLLEIAQDVTQPLTHRVLAINFAIRGGMRQGYVGPTLTDEQKAWNRRIGANNRQLALWRADPHDSEELLLSKAHQLAQWVAVNADAEQNTLRTTLLETRFSRYLSRVVHLDFGTLRNDHNKTVISEVTKRLKYSLTLAMIPMGVTFILCQLFGMWMAVRHNQCADISLNILFLILFAIPVFVVAPFLIEKVALHHTFPGTTLPIPLSGFHSAEATYQALTASQRLRDIALHLLLPLTAIMYGTLAVQARLSRTAFLEVLKQDYVRTAHAKGLPRHIILFKHVGRNGAVTIITALASSLGVILGGSLIVETVFEINGFGRFFYDAVLNRDYNVVLFSALAGSALTLIGYLIADIAYMALDPRISLD